MKNILLFILCFCCLTFVSAQKFNFGPVVSGFVNKYYLSEDNFNSLTNYQNTADIGGNIGLFLSYQATDKFSVDFIPQFGIKSIDFHRNVNEGKQNNDELNIDFFSIDLLFLGKVKIDIAAFQFFPSLGLNFGINKNINTSYKDTSKDNIFSEFLFEDITARKKYAPENIFIAPAIVPVLFIGHSKSNFRLSFQYFINPTDYFREEISVPFESRDNPVNINGKSRVFMVSFYYTLFSMM